MSGLPARTGRDWLKQGFALFRVQPGIMTMLLFVNFLVSMLLSSLPVIGPFIAVILIPSFSMAIMEACNQAAQGQPVRPAVLLTGFRAPVVGRLCKLGLVYAGVSLLLTLLVKFGVSDAFWQQAAKPIDPKTVSKEMSADMRNLMLIFLLQALLLMALCFSAPLSYWKQMPAFKATFYSVFGVLGAWRAMAVMLLTWFALLMFACLVAVLVFSSNLALTRVVMMWLALIFVLVLQCATYISYRQIFGDPAHASDAGLPGAGK